MKVFYIQCRTGCTCCSDENHSRGLYATREEADARIARWRRGEGNPVGSQYSRYGNYSIQEVEAEEISNGRLIIESTVFPNVLITVNLADGSIAGDDYLTNDAYL